MRSIVVVTEIPAPPSVAWEVLTDTAAFAEWNPFLLRLTGDLEVGSRLKVRIQPPGGRAMTFRPRVVAVEPERRLEWLGRVGVPGLMDGRHRFELEELPDGGCRFTHAEVFSGALVPLVGTTLRRAEAGFAAMNEALRRRCVETMRS
jgi:hypothetical protein